ncbi:hypothetical protein ACFOGI_04085 [Virgibacillus xinjiangensis]|uniref:Uncharacterized protein n=1 Tax=Virgibacillus xinjiangensis TaxID=393090 RepID=A0ABV7CT47_9BACI
MEECEIGRSEDISNGERENEFIGRTPGISSGAAGNRQESGDILRSGRKSAEGQIYQREEVNISRTPGISSGEWMNRQEDPHITSTADRSVRSGSSEDHAPYVYFIQVTNLPI